MTKRKEINKEFKEAVWKQGFSLEHDVYVKLQERAWIVLPNRYFKESDSEIVREYDLLAYKIAKYKIGDKEFMFVLALIIECKFNPYEVVFYVRKLENKNYPLIHFIGDGFSSIFSLNDIAKVMDSLKKYQQEIFLSKQQVFGYQAFKEEPRKKNKIPARIYKSYDNFIEQAVFKAINTVASAARYEKTTIQTDSSGKNSIFIWFPIAIFSGNLYQATFSSARKSIKQENIFRYQTGISSPKEELPDQYYVHIVSMEELSNFLDIFEELFQKLNKNIEKIIKRLQ